MPFYQFWGGLEANIWINDSASASNYPIKVYSKIQDIEPLKWQFLEPLILNFEHFLSEITEIKVDLRIRKIGFDWARFPIKNLIQKITRNTQVRTRNMFYQHYEGRNWR